jgi:hypothetical protein
MAYAEQREIQITDTAAVTSTGGKGALAAGVNPYILRRVGFLVTTAPTVQSLIARVEKSTTGAAFAALNPTCTITVPTTATVGQVYWSETALNVVCTPGDRLQVNVTQAPTAGAGSFIFVIDPSYDSPLNDAQLVKVTS